MLYPIARARARVRGCKNFLRGLAPLVVVVLAVVAAPAHGQGPTSTSWITGTATLGSWGDSAN